VFLAGGSVALEQYWNKETLSWMKFAYPVLMLALTVVALPLTLPVLPVEDFIQYERMLGFTPKQEERSRVGLLPQGYADEFGWKEMVAGVAVMYDSLTPEEQSQCIIYVRNYGEAGAIDFFGKKYGLPGATCGHNNYWLWGPGNKSGNVAIVLGDSRNLQDNLNDLHRVFEQVEPGFTTDCSLCMPYESGRQFFICRGIKIPIEKLWPGERHYI